MPQFAWNQAAAQAAGTVFGIGVQRLGANYDRRQQLKTQDALTKMQLGAEEQLMDYQSQKQFDMWNKTGYAAQKQQMKDAGLSPGLMYGQSGGGAQTIGGGMPGAVGANAGYVDTTGKGMELGQQLANMALIKAQTENIQADTKNKESENPNIPKAGAKLDAETKSITQGIQNQIAAEALTKSQRRITDIAGNVAEESQDDAIQRIHSESYKAMQDATIAMIQAGVDTATQQDKINILKAEAAGKLLENALTAVQTDKTKTAIQVDKAQITKMGQDIAQGWEGLSIKMKEARVKGVLDEYNARYQGLGKYLPADPGTMARQIDEILSIRPQDFKNKKPVYDDSNSSHPKGNDNGNSYRGNSNRP